jgi:hypothetical protein
VEWDWRRRWESCRAVVRSKGEGSEPADFDPELRGRKLLRKHKGLKKHESSLPTQVRTRKAGLRAFLFQRGVPEVKTPLCRCGEGEETPSNLALYCPELSEEREQFQGTLAPQALRSTRDFAAATADPTSAPLVVRWLLATSRFPEYQLSRRYAEIQDRRIREKDRG